MLLLSNVCLPSKEAFCRQIIGWREYMRMLYLCRQSCVIPPDMAYKGSPVPKWLWELKLPVPPEFDFLADTLKTLNMYGYNHHIERLMVLRNTFILMGIDPHAIYDWFNNMYIDAYPWVMYGNVFLMGVHRPYFCSANYLIKMGMVVSDISKNNLNELYHKKIAALHTNEQLRAYMYSYPNQRGVKEKPKGSSLVISANDKLTGTVKTRV